MHYYADEDILRGPYLMRRFDAEMIGALLDDLRPERAQVILTAPGRRDTERSPYYDVPTRARGPEAIMLSQLARRARRATRCICPTRIPSLPRTRRCWRWRRTTRRHRSCATTANAAHLVPAGGGVPCAQGRAVRQLSFAAGRQLRHGAGRRRRCTRVSSRMRSTSTPTRHCWRVWASISTATAQGISLRVSGYNDKQLRLLEELLAAIDRQVFEPARFERIRREMVLELRTPCRAAPDVAAPRRPAPRRCQRRVQRGSAEVRPAGPRCYPSAGLPRALLDQCPGRGDAVWQLSAKCRRCVARLLAGVMAGDRGEAAAGAGGAGPAAGAALQLVRSIDHARRGGRLVPAGRRAVDSRIARCWR
jgi:hypothetical protein